MKKRNVWIMTNEILGHKTSDPIKYFSNRFKDMLSAANFINKGFSSIFSEKNLISVPTDSQLHHCHGSTSSEITDYASIS